MWLDVVALILLGVFIGIGWLRGALASFIGLAAFLVAYAVSFIAGPALGGWLPFSPDTPRFIRVGLAGCLAFAVVYVLVMIAGGFVRRAQRERSGPDHSLRDRSLGGALGALRGLFVILIVSWLVLWLDALRTTGVPAVVPPIASSRAARATSAVIEASLDAALAGSGPAGPFVARLAARPALAIEDLERLIENPRFETLRADAPFWSYVEAGAVDTAMGRVSFRDLAADRDLRRDLAALGVVPPEAADDEAAFETAAAAALREVGPRLRALREDPELAKLMDDPEVAAMVRSGDTVGLLENPRFRALVSRSASATP